ncbi:MAG: hypothetical protein BGO92_01830 [Magnetospirillum sp. 64-120]|nr:MAG: hypothetical protein BGO92_01830 [Magnetospirillum sp. 64-120]
MHMSHRGLCCGVEKTLRVEHSEAENTGRARGNAGAATGTKPLVHLDAIGIKGDSCSGAGGFAGSAIQAPGAGIDTQLFISQNIDVAQNLDCPIQIVDLHGAPPSFRPSQ